MDPLFEPGLALVHARADEASALALTTFLRGGMRVNATLESTDEGTLVDAFERALSCDFVLVLLSPHAVARRGSGQQWERAMAEASDLGARIAVFPLADCVPPGVLRQCPWLSHRRLVKRWLLGKDLRAVPVDSGLEPLFCLAADQPGVAPLPAGSPLVSRFVEASRNDFEAVVALDCAGRSPENLVSEILLGLGVTAESWHTANLERAAELLAPRRVLLALDRLEFVDLVMPMLGPWCSLVYAPPAERAIADPVEVAAELRRHSQAALQWAEAAFQLAAPSAWELAREIGALSLRLLVRERRNAEALRWADCLLEEARLRMDRDLAVEAAREKAWILDYWRQPGEFPSIAEPPGEQMSLFG